MIEDSARGTVRRFVEAWNEMNLAAIDDIFAPDYTVNGILVPPDAVKKAVAWLHVFRSPGFDSRGDGCRG